MSLVAISGMPGALGDEVAATLATRLGYRLVHWPPLQDRITIDRSCNVRALRHVMLDLAIEDNIVVIGPGAGQVAPELRDVVRTLLVASGEVRLGAKYMRFVFEVEDWADPRHWDLVINTDRVGVAMAAALVSVAVDWRRRAQDPEDGRRLANLLLARRVERALMDRSDVNVSSLRVRVEAANVDIRGMVETEIERERVAAIVQTISGVRRVHNEIRIHMPFLTI